jgi:hypothetical protein
MTTLDDRSTETSPKHLRAALVSTPEVWGAIAIASMWLAVLFASIYGGDFVSVSGGGTNSDVVAMGARPTALLVGLGVPPDTDVAWVELCLIWIFVMIAMILWNYFTISLVYRPKA